MKTSIMDRIARRLSPNTFALVKHLQRKVAFLEDLQKVDDDALRRADRLMEGLSKIAMKAEEERDANRKMLDQIRAGLTQLIEQGNTITLIELRAIRAMTKRNTR